jgi:putative MATE family efflux protein
MSEPISLTQSPILPTILRLSVPNIFAMVAMALVSVAETTYVGQLGTAPLAGMALVFPLIMLQQMLSSGAMGGGISSAVSRAIGSGNEAKANALALHAVLISLALGFVMSGLMLVWGKSLFELIGGQAEALEQALLYAQIAFFGASSIWLTNAFASVIRGSGNMKTPSITLLAVALGQVVFGGVLGLGLGPVPAFGMAGIALGQVLSFSLGGLYLYAYLRSDKGRVRLTFAKTFQRAYFADILKVGALASISSLQTVLTILILTKMVASLGEEALAGYGIGTRLEFLLIPMTFAIGVACVPLVGMAMGAGLVKRARQVAWTGAFVSACMVGVIGLLVAIFPDQWTRLFTSNAQVMAYAKNYFLWVGPTYAFFAFGLCLYFASQGAGKLVGPVLAGTLRLTLVAVGGLYLLRQGADASDMFALISLSMLMYGVLTGIFMYCGRWDSVK